MGQSNYLLSRSCKKNLSYQSISKIAHALDYMDKSIKGVNNNDPWIIAEEIVMKLSKRS